MDSCTPSSRTNRSLVMIDSISINIDAAELSKSEKCEHFTIRGFVSETRTNDRSSSWPVFSDGHDASSMDVLSTPHMEVPKFKRWQCQSCLSKIDSGAVEDTGSTTINCTRHLKIKGYRLHRSLENVITHLSKKSEQHLKLGWVKCKGTKSPGLTQKSCVYSDTGLRERELHSAVSVSIPKKRTGKGFNNQLAALIKVHKHQDQRKRSTLTTPIKAGTIDVDKHSGRHAIDMRLVQNHQNNDGLGATGRRKTKKVRLLDDLFDKDKNSDQPAMIRNRHANEASRLSYVMNEKCHEQDSRQSQMQIADGTDRNVEMRHEQGIQSTFADVEMQMTPKDGTVAIVKQAEIMLLGNNKGADVQTDNYDGGQEGNINLCRKQCFMPTCQPFYGKAVDPQQNSITQSSQLKEKSCDTLYKVHQGKIVKTTAKKSKGKIGISVLKNSPAETSQSFHQPHSILEDHSSKIHYRLSDGCLDTRKGTRYYVPHTENKNLQNDFTVQYNEEPRSVCNSGLKRAKQGPCVGNKKKKRSPGTEGVTVVRQTELLFDTRHKCVVVSHESPVHNINMTPEIGASDDIPMEIVELMAKNQYERRLHEVGNNHYMHQLTSNKKHDVMGSAGVLSNVVSATVQDQKSHLQSNLLNVWVNSEKVPGTSNKRPQGRNFQRSFGSTYSPVQSSLRSLSSGFHSSSLSFSEPDLFRNCKFDMNSLPPQHKVSPKAKALYKEWQPASRQCEKTYHAWQMVPPSNSVHMFNARQCNGVHPFDVSKVPACSSYVVEGGGLNNFSVSGSLRSSTANSFGLESSNSSCSNRVHGEPQMAVSPDPYPNETLTAMHLLSLMDDGMHSSSSTLTNVETNANRKTFDKSFYNDHLAGALTKNNLGLGNSNHRFNPPSSNGYRSNASQSDTTYRSSPPIPKFDSVVTPLPGDVGKKESTSSHQKKGCEHQNPRLAFRSGINGQELIPAHELSKQISGHMWYGPGSTHAYIQGNNNGYYNFIPAQPCNTLKSRFEPGPCYVNRNPMDFTTPGPGNEYMIGTEELKIRNRIHNPYITGPFATNSLQQNKFTTYATTARAL